MTTEYTPNFRFNMPDFRMGPWHDLMNTNTFRLDQILLAIYQGVDTAPWENNKLYTPGMTAIDLTDNSFWVCAFEHTSAPAPTTFAADRAAHPTFWIRTVVGITPRGQWLNSTHYLVNDMVSDADQGVIAICITEHDSIASPGTIRDDAAFWTFIVDMTGSGANQAAYIVYDNTTSGTTQTNLQGTTDEIYARLSTIDGNIVLIGTALTDLDTRVDALEVSDAAQDAAITSLQSNDTNQEIRLTAAEGTISGHETRISNLEADVANDLEDAPSDGEIYARQNAAWVIVSGGGASVLVSDTPPAGADPNSLWWESDTGQLYILYDDGDTQQWVVAVPQLDAGSFVAKSGDTMTGPLVLSADPTALLGAATKQYADARGEFGNYYVSVTQAANALTLALKHISGVDPSATTPVYMMFRTASGLPAVRAITAPVSLVVPAGATIGTVSGSPFRLWVAAFDDGGTVKLAVRKCSNEVNYYSILSPPEHAALSVTSPPGNVPHTFYTAGGAITSKYWKWIAYLNYEAGQVTAGNWATGPSYVELVNVSTPRPGTVLQELFNKDNVLTTINASAALTEFTGPQTPITCVSAANFTRISCAGYFYLRQGAAGQQATLYFRRDSTNITINPSNCYTAAAGDIINNWHQTVYDFPKTTAQVTYKIAAQNVSATGQNQFQTFNHQVEELMT